MKKMYPGRRALPWLAGLTLALLLLLPGCGAAQEDGESAAAPEGEAQEEVTREKEGGIQPPREDDSEAEETKPTPTPTPRPTDPLDALRDPKAEVSDMPAVMADTNVSQAQKIQNIRDWYYATETTDKPNLSVKKHDDSYTSFWKDGKLVKVDVNERLDPTTAEHKGIDYHYYYHDGMPYFAYIVDLDRKTELRLYFWNGSLIRWLENDRVIHETANARYAAYCQGAWEIAQLIETLPEA